MMPTEYNFKILSLDGGGMKGLYTAAVLTKLEETFEGCLADYFDMICGTSTGGLLALALSLKVPAHKLVAFYETHGPEIFGTDNFALNYWRTFKQTVLGGKYSDQTLRAAADKVLGSGRQMSDATTLLCIPSFNLMKGIPRVFKFPHLEGNVPREKYGAMLDVALATSAAPTYFPIADIDGSYYVDGGVWANNPTLCGVQEALEYFVGADKILQGLNAGKVFTSYAVLSVASLAERDGWTTRGANKRRHRSFLGWRDRLFQTSLDAQSHFADRFAQVLVKNTTAPGSYVRLEGPPLTPSHYQVVGLDKASPAALRQLKTFGRDQGDHYCTRLRPQLEPFFTHPKHYLTQSYHHA